jgi:hypothetical protein
MKISAIILINKNTNTTNKSVPYQANNVPSHPCLLKSSLWSAILKPIRAVTITIVCLLSFITIVSFSLQLEVTDNIKYPSLLRLRRI